MIEYIVYLIAILISIYLVIFILIITSSNKYGFEKVSDINYMIVLGCRENSNALSARLNLALSIANQTDVDIILSGCKKSGEEMSEARFMFNYLVDNGIDANRLIIEDRSSNTCENLKFCKELITTNASGVIITNNFHVLRVKMLANKFGLNTYVMPAMIEVNRDFYIEVFALIKCLISTKGSK